jgi:hypothetical protein
VPIKFKKPEIKEEPIQPVLLDDLVLPDSDREEVLRQEEEQSSESTRSDSILELSRIEHVSNSITKFLSTLDTSGDIVNLGSILSDEPDSYLKAASQIEESRPNARIYPIFVEIQQDIISIRDRLGYRLESDALISLDNDRLDYALATLDAGERWKKSLSKNLDLVVARDLIEYLERYRFSVDPDTRENIRLLAKTLRLVASALSLEVLSKRETWKASRKNSLNYLQGIVARAVSEELISVFASVESRILHPLIDVSDLLIDLSNTSKNTEALLSSTLRPLYQYRYKYVNAISSMKNSLDNQYQQRLYLIDVDIERIEMDNTVKTLLLISNFLETSVSSGSLDSPWLERLKRDVERRVATSQTETRI